jgi:8-amino-7-oxononanoate synthase
MSAAKLSGAKTVRLRHNDTAHAAQVLAAERGKHRHCLVLVDGVYSMDGDLAPLPDLAALAGRHDAWLMTDDAHALGTVGGGRGSAAAFDLSAADVPLQMGTLSKALGAQGGYLCASRAVCELMRNRARPFVYATGLAPAAAGAALAALDILAADPALAEKPLAAARRFCAALGLPVPDSPVVPVVLGPAEAALDASAQLEEAGFLVTAIRPPTVPEGTARLRIAFSAAHREAQIDALAAAVAPLLPRSLEAAQ